MSNINWDDNAKRAACLFYDFIDEQGVSYASPDKMQRDFFDWLALPQQKTVADEGEKWTHTIDGLKVRFLVDGPDEAGEVPVASDDGYYRIFDVDQLEPIKPKLTKSQAWDKICESEHEFDIVNRIKQMYDII